MAERKLNAVEVKYWINEGKSCDKRFQKEVVQRNQYPKTIEYYEGSQGQGDEFAYGDNQSVLAVLNEYFPNTNSLISEVMYQNPDVIADARKPQAEAEAPTMKSALQYGFDEVDGVIENRLALFDMIYAGFSAVELDHIVLRPDSKRDESQTKEAGVFGKMIRKAKKVLNMEDAEDKAAEEQGMEESAYSTNEMTYMRRISPMFVRLDWRAERFKDSRYIMKHKFMSKGEFDKTYPEFKSKVTAGVNEEFNLHSREEYKKCIHIIEFQVKKENDVYETIQIAPSYPMEALIAKDRPYVHNGFNIKIGYLHRYGKLYPISIAKQGKSLQDDKNNYITHLMEVAERSIPKWGVNANKTSNEGIEALKSNNVMDVVKFNGGAESAFPLFPPPPAQINAELIGVFDNTQDQIWSISEARAQGKGSAKFATELEIQEAGFMSKQSDLQEGLRILIQDELELMKDIIVQFWDMPVFLKTTGLPKPQWYEPEIDPVSGVVLNPLTDMLTGDYWIKVDITSSMRPNKMRKRVDLVEFLRLSGEMFPLLQGLGVDPSYILEVYKRAAKEYGVSPELIQVKEQPPQPEEEPREPVDMGSKKTTIKRKTADEMGNEQEIIEESEEKIYG